MTAAIEARPTLYKGIQMRSRLEADYAAAIDAAGYRWQYEPECFASSDGQWLPDFGITLPAEPGEQGKPPLFVEVKPAGPLMKHAPGSVAFVEHADKVLRHMAIAWESRPEARLTLVFWRYGGPGYLSLYCQRRGDPWLATFDGQPMDLIWRGATQYVKAKQLEPGLHDEIARRWLGLAGVVAAHTWPGGLCNGVLIIYADSQEWAAKARQMSDGLIQILDLVFCEGLIRKVDVQLCAVAS